MPSRISEKQSDVQRGDSHRPNGVPKSAKQNAKQNANRIFDDPDLTCVIDAWSDLPEAIRAAILAIVQTATNPKGEPARKSKE